MRPTIMILLVDDHAFVRQGCRLLLEQAGIEIAGEAASGEEAYASCQAPAAAVVVVDLAMPGMGGLEAIRRIRARFTESAVVVFTTTHDRYPGPQGGATAFVTKTSAPRDLVEAVRRAVKGSAIDPRGRTDRFLFSPRVGAGGEPRQAHRARGRTHSQALRLGSAISKSSLP